MAAGVGMRGAGGLWARRRGGFSRRSSGRHGDGLARSDGLTLRQQRQGEPAHDEPDGGGQGHSQLRLRRHPRHRTLDVHDGQGRNREGAAPEVSDWR